MTFIIIRFRRRRRSRRRRRRRRRRRKDSWKLDVLSSTYLKTTTDPKECENSTEISTYIIHGKVYREIIYVTSSVVSWRT